MNTRTNYIGSSLFPVEWAEQPDLHTDTLPGMEFLP